MGTQLPFSGAWLGWAPGTPATSHWKVPPPLEAATQARRAASGCSDCAEVPAWRGCSETLSFGAQGRHVFSITSWCFFNTQLPAGSTAALQPECSCGSPRRCGSQGPCRAWTPVAPAWGAKGGWWLCPWGWTS